ncbi:hypothetical protein [Microbulbifer sp. ZKSA002]|uniref:hypothetical protein n=1 Tax=Microbulbifer sp. ZKSA002 TaxID=3243388 RepID=UPI00403965B8
MKLEVGATYYRIMYADPILTMPALRPLVFVGKQIFDDSDLETYYFQGTVSYVRFGELGKGEIAAEDIQVFESRKAEIRISIVTLEMAVKEVT